MTPANINDEPLGNKHKEFNKQVQDAIMSQKPLEKEFDKSNNDLDNLLKIDVACHTKDVNYIISVLKSDDMLCVSRAIKQSPWLVDDQYANIINPEFLNEHLFPNMKVKASIKLLKHIRHYLKNESRVEEFYKNETNNVAAAKWLSRCSIYFIENNVCKHIGHITDLEFKRLCERSVTVFEAAMKDTENRGKLKAASFLLHTHADKYLDVFDNTRIYRRPTFGPTATALIMKKTPDRIINDFLKYENYIHIPTFIENIKREQIKDFLFKLANQKVEGMYEQYYRSVFHFKIIKQFVQRMPKEQQFEFAKKVFLDYDNIVKINDETLQRGTEMFAIKQICTHVRSTMPIYHWYEFGPFNVAFDEIKKLIEAESNINEKYSMYGVLLKCAAKNTKDFLDLLMYYSKNSSNDNVKMKLNFINTFISVTEIYKNDLETWNTFKDIIESMNIYSENDHQYIHVIVLHDILHDKQVAEAILDNLSFKTLRNCRKKLNKDEQNKVFEYLHMFIMKKLQGHNIQTDIEFREAVQILESVLSLFLDWDKELADFPFALEKIKDLIRIRKDNAWKVDLSSLYNQKKSWRRLMFEESVTLNPSQNVLLNALKHNPGLLARYQSDVDALCCDDAISLKRVLRKLRIYWPNLADSWTKAYLDRLDKVGGHKALTRGLSTLLSQELLLDIIKKYTPAQPKIDWNNTNELTLGLQRCFAKNMHIARPQPSADTVLLYAKGDFLQYALPSLFAIYYDMSRVESQEHIPKLLNAPVSLQKHGLRFAFIKLKHDELKFHLCNTWQASKNISIRAVTFGLLFDLMCKEQDTARAEELWEILEVFMDNLTFKEDKKIYEKLSKVNDVPEPIKPKFLVKSYTFLKALLPNVKIDRETYENSIRSLAYYTRTIMEFMCPEFVANIITEHLDANFCIDTGLDNNMLNVTTSYLLCAKDEETQNKRYEKVLVPLIKRAMNQWDQINEDKYFVRRNFQNLLCRLYRDLETYVVQNKMIVPTKMFQNIQKEIDASLPVPQNYIILRMWQLIVKVTEIIEKNDKREDWQKICSEMVPELGTYCLNVLRGDVKEYFPCIYVLFQKVLNISVENVLKETLMMKIYEVLLNDTEFIQAYLLVLNMLPRRDRDEYSDDDNVELMKEMEIRKLLYKQSSVEVKMHYYCKFGGDSDSPLGI